MLIRLLTACWLMTSLGAMAEAYPDPRRWEGTIAGFALEDEVIGDRSGQIVATGSSSMRLWNHRIHQDLAPLPIIAKGFGGSNMNDVLFYLDGIVLKHNPRAVLLYEGDNDIAQGVPNETILQTYKETFARLHAHDAAMRVYILSVKPSLSRAHLWSQMQALNESLAAMAETDDRLHYIDVTTPMLDRDGSIRTDLFVSDDLHMNQRGYDIWRDVVGPVLRAGEIR